MQHFWLKEVLQFPNCDVTDATHVEKFEFFYIKFDMHHQWEWRILYALSDLCFMPNNQFNTIIIRQSSSRAFHRRARTFSPIERMQLMRWLVILYNLKVFNKSKEKKWYLIEQVLLKKWLYKGPSSFVYAWPRNSKCDLRHSLFSLTWRPNAVQIATVTIQFQLQYVYVYLIWISNWETYEEGNSIF